MEGPDIWGPEGRPVASVVLTNLYSGGLPKIAQAFPAGAGCGEGPFPKGGGGGSDAGIVGISGL